jgi:hypothetical protein
VRDIGLDVHREFCEVAIAEASEVRSAGRIETTPEALELFAQGLGRDDRVALEVTGNAWEVARIIEPHVARVLVVSPSDTGIRQARAKTDRLDARTLAKLIAAGSLEGLWMPDASTRALRRRLQRPAGAGAHPRQERGPRGADAAFDRKAPSQRSVRGRGPPLARGPRAARRGARDGRQLPAPDRLPRARAREPQLGASFHAKSRSARSRSCSRAGQQPLVVQGDRRVIDGASSCT